MKTAPAAAKSSAPQVVSGRPTVEGVGSWRCRLPAHAMQAVFPSFTLLLSDAVHHRNHDGIPDLYFP